MTHDSIKCSVGNISQVDSENFMGNQVWADGANWKRVRRIVMMWRWYYCEAWSGKTVRPTNEQNQRNTTIDYFCSLFCLCCCCCCEDISLIERSKNWAYSGPGTTIAPHTTSFFKYCNAPASACAYAALCISVAESLN